MTRSRKTRKKGYLFSKDKCPYCNAERKHLKMTFCTPEDYRSYSCKKCNKKIVINPNKINTFIYQGEIKNDQK